MITIQELNKVIKNLNNKAILDSDSISNIMIKKLPMQFRLTILSLFNLSLSSNTIPSLGKQSIITMIPKKGDKSSLKNYRPISSTSNIMKLFEKLIHSRVSEFLISNDIIIKQQSGFRKNRQTRDNLILSQKILETFGTKGLFSN